MKSRFYKKRPIGVYVLISMAAAASLNIIIGLSGLMDIFPAYGKTMQNSSVFSVAGVLLSCLIMPVMEETIFRLVIYNALRKYLNYLFSIFISAALFGMYHGNMIQFIYALIMGSLFACCYESDHRILVPISMHIAANAAVMAISAISYTTR